MNKTQVNLLIKRCIYEPRKYKGCEPDSVKKKKDLIFCIDFFGREEFDNNLVESLISDSITNKNEEEFDLLLTLLEHFKNTKNFDLILAELLIQPWHHFHDRIATILEFDKNEDTIEFLCKGAFYRCDNLEYESDYCSFNRKCIYALAKIGTPEALNCIEKISASNKPIISNYAEYILKNIV